MLIQIRGVNIEAFNPKMSVGFNKSKALNVGFVGRLTMEKGTDILLETMDMLSSNCNIIFHIASPENIKAEIKQKNKNLIWHGYVPHEEVPILMKSFDVLILPSHMEGRSQTMMEAMACGLPVLLQEKIHPELLPGMVHCNENIQTFVDALNELARDQNKLIKLSEEARQSAIKYFDKSIWSKEMVKTFQEFLKGN